MSDKLHQIRQAYAPLIHAVVDACGDDNKAVALKAQLAQLKEHDMGTLADLCERILNGERSVNLLIGLDTVERAIASGILEALKNPEALPEVSTPDPAEIAKGLASLIFTAATGDKQAYINLSQVAAEMRDNGGSLAEIEKPLTPLLNGMRHWDTLSRDLSPANQSLLKAILDELGRLESEHKNSSQNDKIEVSLH